MEKKQRKRGRPKTKFIKKDKENKINKKLFDIKTITETTKNEFTNLLVHLPIDISLINNSSIESYEKEYLTYDNILSNIIQEPKPFETELVEEIINYEEKKIEYTEKVIYSDKHIEKKVYTLEQKKNDVLCWWCCHSYDNQTYGIPIKKENEVYVTKGYFCSLSCAKSYNNNDNILIKEKQNRNLLIEMLNDEITENSKDVEMAPPRETLKVFGGVLTIEEFRKNDKIIKLVYPPLITIIPYIEEITIEESNSNVKINKNLIKNNLLKLFK